MHQIEKIYQLHSKQLFQFLFYLTGNHSLAEELLQETFFQAFISIHRFKNNSKVKTWLYQIAKNVYYKNQKKRRIEQYTEFYEENIITNSLSPEALLITQESKREILECIKGLDEPYKQVIILRIFNEFPFKLIGEIFSKKENWARVTYYRGKIKILEKINKEGDEQNEL